MSATTITPFEKCRAYIEAVGVAKETLRTLPLITISREAGAGAVPIAHMVADELNQSFRPPGTRPWTVFDKNLVEQILEDHELPKRLERYMPEDIRQGIRYSVEELLGLHPSSWTLMEHTVDTILRLANIGHCILVGRGSTVITSTFHNALHVRLVAPFAYRVQQMAAERYLTENEAEIYVAQTDRARRRYLARYHGSNLDDPTLHDVVLNTSRFTPANAAHIICHSLKTMLESLEEA